MWYVDLSISAEGEGRGEIATQYSSRELAPQKIGAMTTESVLLLLLALALDTFHAL